MTQDTRIYQFDSAIVRQPSFSVTDGLRAGGGGDPTYDGVKAEHDAYITALETAGVTVQVLGALEEFPDSIFVEDPALVYREGAIVLRPGDKTRSGEAAVIAPVLRAEFDQVLDLPRGFVDGGDVLNTPESVMIGLSERTTREGAEALVECLAQLGRKGLIFKTPENVLHFKSDCSLLDDETILATARLVSSGVFNEFRTILTPDGEEAAANALRINDTILLSEDCPETLNLLTRAGYNVVTLQISEIAKIDAGLSCMSLRWLAG